MKVRVQPDHHGVGRSLGHDGHAPVGQRLETPSSPTTRAVEPAGSISAATSAERSRSASSAVMPQWARLPVQLGPGRRRVVRGEQHPHAGAAQAGHRLVDAGDGPPVSQITPSRSMTQVPPAAAATWAARLPPAVVRPGAWGVV